MARSPEQRARARQQRVIARIVKTNRDKPREQRQRILPKAITAPSLKARLAYADKVLAGQEPRPEKGTLEANNLASLAGYARWGKVDGKYLEFQEYWYHGKGD